VFHLGIAGAAIATVLSQLVSFSILLSHFTKKRSMVTLSFQSVRLEKALYAEILRCGLPTFFRQGLASAAVAVLNLYAKPFGDPAIAGMAIVNRVVLFIMSILIGFGQGFQPVSGFNYGAKKYDRVSEAFFFCVKVGTVAFLILSFIGFDFAPEIVRLFRAEDAEVVRVGALALRLQCLTLPLQVFIVIPNMLFQTVGRPKEAMVLALMRQGLCLLPLVVLLTRVWGLLGVQASQPIADAVTFLVAVPLTMRFLNEMKQKRTEAANIPENLPADIDLPESIE
jgi:Na+-driven multidrug efflux pump